MTLAFVLTAVAVWATEHKERRVVKTGVTGEVAPAAVAIPGPVKGKAVAAGVAPLQEGTPDSRVRECQAVLKTLATGLEMYATDHSGQYPEDLKELTPTYLPTLPRCPSADSDTYKAGYSKGQSAPYNDRDDKDFYHLACSGSVHAEAGLAVNMPAINCRLGLMPDLPFLGTPQQARAACGKNLTMIATCLELYAIDHNGRYPTTLAELSGDYLPKVPLCPATGKDTYSANLKVGPSAPHNPGDFQAYFYLQCTGAHVGPLTEPRGPSYDSVRGLADQ